MASLTCAGILPERRAEASSVFHSLSSRSADARSFSSGLLVRSETASSARRAAGCEPGFGIPVSGQVKHSLQGRVLSLVDERDKSLPPAPL